MKMIAIILLLLSVKFVDGQVLEKTNWCLSDCRAAGDELKNTKAIFMGMRAPSISARDFNTKISFPIRAVYIQDYPVTQEEKILIEDAIEKLNFAFSGAHINFSLETVINETSEYDLEDLTANQYASYNSFSAENDLDDMISVYIFTHQDPFCQINPNSISCSRVGGFSYILSERTNNIVLSRFDLTDFKVVAHEFGHFFGLYHTFEEQQFGKDNFNAKDCEVLGDCLCDTPPDPGAVYEVYVNYTICEMLGLTDDEGNYYNPQLNNYMSYYKPCYQKSYLFTQGQLNVLNYAANSNLRKQFSR